MSDLLQRLKQHKLVQWAVAYVAAAWVVLQVLDLIFGSYNWPKSAMHIAFGVLAVGFVVVLVLAWYHGERGAQRVSGVELLIVALILAVGGGVLWNFSRTTAKARTAPAMASARASQPTGQRVAATATGKQAAGPAGAASVARGAAPPISAEPIPAKSVAVLPFENLSADKANAYFADGIQDLILTKLADIGDLKVIARTSTESYGSHPQNLTKVGQQLGVATILEGSVQKAGKQVLINVQLIDASTDSHIWAQSYQRTLDNIFGVEGEVAEKVATALNAKLTASESVAIAKVPTHNKQAYQAFLKANYFHDNFNRTSDYGALKKSIALLKEAVAADPNFASAWTMLALDYADTENHSEDEEKAVRRALAIDPNNAYAHTMYAFVLSDRENFKQAIAIAQAQEGVRLNPKGPYNIAGLGIIDAEVGRFDRAEALFTQCTKLDPRHNFCRGWTANIAMMQRHYATARDTLRYVVNDDPGNIIAATALANACVFGWGDLAAARKPLQGVPTPVASSGTLSDAWYWLDLYARDYSAALAVVQQAPKAWFQQPQNAPLALYQARVYRAQGEDKRAKQAFAQARATLEAAMKHAPRSAAMHANLAVALAGLGHGQDAVMGAQRAVKLADPITFYARPYDLAVVEAWSGNTAASLKLLDGLLGKPAGGVVSVNMLKLDPTWDVIRHDPAFQALLTKFGENEPVATSASAPGGSGHDYSMTKRCSNIP